VGGLEQERSQLAAQLARIRSTCQESLDEGDAGDLAQQILRLASDGVA